MLFGIHQVEVEDEETGETTTRYRLTNADNRGYGDVVQAVSMIGYYQIPRKLRHPARCAHLTREEAVAVAESLCKELKKKFGGTFAFCESI